MAAELKDSIRGVRDTVEERAGLEVKLDILGLLVVSIL
jgi:hypothetical protein